jgi:tRNA-2-methylthio-N6-dimethylallyladenosine synthase
MNRGHTAESYLRQIEKVRAARPDIAISGDMIVGFPGEDEAAFEETMALTRAVDYASCFSFKYSRRPGTPGATMAKQVAEEVKSERLQRLQALLNEQRAAFDEAQLGRVLPMLLEKPGRQQGQLIGKSPYLQSVFLEADASRIGEIVNVRIEGRGVNSLRGALISI